MKHDTRTELKTMPEVRRDFPELQVIPIVLNGEQRLGLGRVHRNHDGTHTCEVMAILVAQTDNIALADMSSKLLN